MVALVGVALGSTCRLSSEDRRALGTFAKQIGVGGSPSAHVIAQDEHVDEVPHARLIDGKVAPGFADAVVAELSALLSEAPK